MIYEYQCPACAKILELDRRVKEHNKPVYCPKCDILMPQLVKGPYITVKSYEGYNNGLGIQVKNKNSVKDELKRINDTEGRVLEEVGTSSAKVKKKHNGYRFSGEEKRQIGKVLHGI